MHLNKTPAILKQMLSNFSEITFLYLSLYSFFLSLSSSKFTCWDYCPLEAIQLEWEFPEIHWEGFMKEGHTKLTHKKKHGIH